MLAIKKITVEREGKKVINGLSLRVRKGEMHALMGPNGSGKTSLCATLLGNPSYRMTKGSVTFDKKNIANLKTEERAKLGMFLSFQEVPEISGVGMSSFLRTIAKKQNNDNSRAIVERVEKIAKQLGLSAHFMERFLNDGFSGGEKRKSEMLQLVASNPKLALLDEIDSGLDIDSLKSIAAILKRMVKDGMGLLLVSHSPRIINMLKPDYIHVMCKGTIVTSGGKEIVRKLEKEGYKSYTVHKVESP